MNGKRKKGFTLIELLATIVILSLVVGIVAYVAINTISNSKEKSYKVTINNIEKIARDYLLENSDRLFYIPKSNDNSIEYQCITIRNLIDMGYFKNDILNSKIDDDGNFVKEEDYIYIARNKTTKAIAEISYGGENQSECPNAVKATGSVDISISPSGWSDYKEIVITYKIKNANDINAYEYKYSYSNMDSLTVISDEELIKKFKVVDNGEIIGYIEYKNDNSQIAENSKNITNIDKIAPVIETSDITKIYGASFDLYEGVSITDNSGEVVSKRVYLDSQEITSYSSLKIGENILTYKASDKFGNESSVSRKIILVVADKEFDYKEEEQVYEVSADGTYVIEANGAQGGNSGGLGGYVKAELSLKVGDKLYITTGGVNGYNGGGGYKNNSYYPGGGATTVKYNNNIIVIAAGGGAKGNAGTPGVGGNGDSAGGSDVGSGSGISGSNGGGGSNSLNYNYSCNCQTCGGGCYDGTYQCNCRTTCDYLPTSVECWTFCSTCGSWYCDPTYKCNCQTCTKNGQSGNGGTSSVVSPAKLITNTPGQRSSNGYVKISYKL